MDRAIRPCLAAPHNPHNPPPPTPVTHTLHTLHLDLYPSLVSYLFHICHLTQVDINLSDDHEDKWEIAHHHTPHDKLPHIVYLSRTCKAMHAEVKKNTNLDRTRALHYLFNTTRNSISNWFVTSPFFGIDREFYTLAEFWPASRRRRVFNIYLKRHQSEFKILCESYRKNTPTTKTIFHITDAYHYDDSDSDSEHPHTETHLTSDQLITAANVWLNEKRDVIVVP
jgi:hypothetical protein